MTSVPPLTQVFPVLALFRQGCRDPGQPQLFVWLLGKVVMVTSGTSGALGAFQRVLRAGGSQCAF